MTPGDAARLRDLAEEIAEMCRYLDTLAAGVDILVRARLRPLRLVSEYTVPGRGTFVSPG